MKDVMDPICFEDQKKMQRKLENFSPFSKKMAARLSVNIGIILNVILTVGYSYNGYLLLDNMMVVLPAALSTILLFFILFRYNFYIVQIPNQKRSAFFVRAVIVSFLAAILFSLFVSSTMSKLMDLGEGKEMFLSINLMKDLMTALIVQLVTYLLLSVHQNQQIILKNQKLIAENIRTRYEVLKNQVDPHFLFNSLNTLDGLISIDTEKAHDYVQNLSAVFRYAIGNKQIIHLSDELDFTQAYIDLMRIRYGENLKVSINVEAPFLDWFIMPVSLQLLVENAIKHNVISTRQPLTIHIETTDSQTLKVWNRIQPKVEDEPGEGVGLGNLAERYKLLFDKDINVTATEIFEVEMPLMEEVDNTRLTV